MPTENIDIIRLLGAMVNPSSEIKNVAQATSGRQGARNVADAAHYAANTLGAGQFGFPMPSRSGPIGRAFDATRNVPENPFERREPAQQITPEQQLEALLAKHPELRTLFQPQSPLSDVPFTNYQAQRISPEMLRHQGAIHQQR